MARGISEPFLSTYVLNLMIAIFRVRCEQDPAGSLDRKRLFVRIVIPESDKRCRDTTPTCVSSLCQVMLVYLQKAFAETEYALYG